MRNTYAATSLRAANNIQRKISDPALEAGAPVMQASTERDGTPVHLSCYGSQPDKEVMKQRKSSNGQDRSSDSMRQSKCSSNDDKVPNEPKRKQYKTLNS